MRRLGRSELAVSIVALGCNNFGPRIDYAAADRVVGRALDLGINHFDTANIYGRGTSEEYLGRALGPRRKSIVLATKFGQRVNREEATTRRGSRESLVASVEASLKRLGTDWIDLLTMHVPDRSTPIEETLRALHALRDAGKIRVIAASNFRPGEVNAADDVARQIGVPGFVACQDEWSLVDRRIEKRLLPTVERLGLSVIPYRPLAGGTLSGKYRRGEALPAGSRHAETAETAARFLGPHWDRVERLRAYAESNGRSLLDLAMSWLARQPLVASIIVGATSAAQVDADVKSVEWALTAGQMATIDRLTSDGWVRKLLSWRWRN